MLKRLCALAAAAALALPLSATLPTAEAAGPAGDPALELQQPLTLERGADPRVLSMVGNQVRFPNGRTVRFTPPQQVTGQARLIGQFRSNAVVWAPYGNSLSAVFKIGPSGIARMVGEPRRDVYSDSEWQLVGSTLYVMSSDAKYRSILTRVDITNPRKSRTWISAKEQLWELIDADSTRALISEQGRVRIWRHDGTFQRVYTQAGNAYSNIRWGSLKHDWFAQGRTDGTELRHISAPSRVVWKKGYENEMMPFDISGDGSVLLTTEFETYSPQLRDARSGRILRSYAGGYKSAFNDDQQLVLEGNKAFLVVMNLVIDRKHREVLVRCTLGGDCERASRVASRITLVTSGP